MYKESDLVAIAKRENNKKRSYLVVDPLQGKHIPVSPKAALDLFRELASKVKNAYQGERILFIGFAESWCKSTYFSLSLYYFLLLNTSYLYLFRNHT